MRKLGLLLVLAGVAACSTTPPKSHIPVDSKLKAWNAPEDLGPEIKEQPKPTAGATAEKP